MAMAVGAAVSGWFVAGGAAAVGAAAAASAVTATLVGALGGAIIGAAIGGLAAAVTGGSIGKGMLFGAVGGAVAGGVSGYIGAGAGAGASSVGGGIDAGGQVVTTSQGAGLAAAEAGVTQYGSLAAAGEAAGSAAGAAAETGSLSSMLSKAPGTIGKEMGAKALGAGIEGYYQDQATNDQIEAQEKEAQLQRDFTREQNALERESAMARLTAQLNNSGGGSNAANRQYELGMNQLGENVRQFDMNRADYLTARKSASDALGGWRIDRKKGSPTPSALETAETAVV